jgi:nucleoside-diphosphate-sugar epimerase
MKQISILGCGWLGFPLAQQLIDDGYQIFGATTSEAKLAILESNDIIPFLIRVSSEGIEGDFTSFLKDSEILILNIPPKLRGVEKEDFVAKVQNIVSEVAHSSIKKVIFVSSTSVYSDDNQVIDEEIIPEPDSESGKQLLQAELLLQSNVEFETTIIRFGGLIGNERHPITFLAGRKNVENPDAPINLIHLEDCIGIIQKIIKKNIWNETFNAVAPFHPTRKEYYTQKAIDMYLETPEFNAEKPSIGKTILSDKVTSILGYTFTKSKL